MCGRPVGFKEDLQKKIGNGSIAVMCPAFGVRCHDRWAQIGSASDIQTMLRHIIAGVQRGLSSPVGSTDHHLPLHP